MEKEKGLLKKTEWIALIVVMHYCLYRFLESTTFDYNYSTRYRAIILVSLALVGSARLSIGLWTEYKKTGITANFVIKLLLMSLFGISSLMLQIKYDYGFFLFLLFCVFCLYGIDVDLVLRCFRICIGLLLMATILCCLAEVIPNYIYFPTDQERSNLLRASYGICYPTDFASYLLFLSLLLWCGGKRKPLLPILCVILLSVFVVYLYANSNTTELCFIIFVVIAMIESLGHTLEKHRKIRWIHKAVDGMAVSAFPLLGMIFYAMTWLYGQGSEFAKQVDLYLHERLSLAWNGIQQYGINLFGALTLQNGNGGGDIHKWLGQYEFLDSTYALLLIRYGIIMTLVFMIVWTWVSVKAIRTGHRKLAYAMAVIAVHAFSEHHFPELNYNIFLAIPLCSFAFMQDSLEVEQKERKTQKWVPWIVGGSITALFVLLLPRLLARMRTVFELKGWFENSLYAFLLFLVFVVLIGMFCFCLTRITMGERKRILVVGMICSVVIVGFLGIWTGSAVNTGLAEKQFSTDAVDIILSSATEPVYADILEEGYERQYPGISRRIWSLEEMGRTRKGTIITSKEPEENKLIETGAIYAEISDESSIYTYDQAVIEALRTSGYILHAYYYTERTLDNKQLAELNGLELAENGGIVLNAKCSLSEEPNLALYGGNYQTIYSLSADPASLPSDGVVCNVAITTYNGEQTILKREIQKDEFDYDGHTDVICDYYLGSSIGVKYEVNIEGIISIVINRISWRRNPVNDIWRTYNERGQIIEENNIMKGEKVIYEYDEKNRIDTELTVDAEGNLKVSDGGYSTKKYQYVDLNSNPLVYYFKDNILLEKGSGYLHDYLCSLQDMNYIVFISVFDDASTNLHSIHVKDMHNLGLQTDLRGKFRYSYYAIISKEEIIEQLGQEALYRTGDIGGINYSILSTGGDTTTRSSIMINGEEHSIDKRGLNIVVYDRQKKKVIDSIAFDMFDSMINTYR